MEARLNANLGTLVSVPRPWHLLFAAWGSTTGSTSTPPVKRESCPRAWKELETQGSLVSQVGISPHAEGILGKK